MKRTSFYRLVGAVAAVVAIAAAPARPDIDPNAHPAATVQAAPSDSIGPSKGTLVIVGGGLVGPEIWSRFIALAGGPEAKIVVIPTAAGNADAVQREPTAGLLRQAGAKNVVVLHTTDRSAADSEAFVEPFKSAGGVWFAGGRQWRIADSYLGTRTEKELEALLDRGGVIGGTSAGASIQGSFLVRGDTSGAGIVDGDHKAGFGFLKNSAIDQHILVRNREFDLIPLIEKHPDLLGIGINESTAIVVHGNQFEVIGKSYVAITDAKQWIAQGPSSPDGAAQKGKIYFVGSGQKFDLATRRVLQGTRDFADRASQPAGAGLETAVQSN